MKLDSCPKCATFWTFRWNLILNVVHKLWNILNPVLGLKSICQTSTSTLLSSEGHSVVSNSLRLHRLYSPWNSPGQNTGVGILSLLQVIFLTQGSNPGLPHYRQILYQLSHKGSPPRVKPAHSIPCTPLHQPDPCDHSQLHASSLGSARRSHICDISFHSNTCSLPNQANILLLTMCFPQGYVEVLAPGDLWMWPYFKTGSLQMSLK